MPTIFARRSAIVAVGLLMAIVASPARSEGPPAVRRVFVPADRPEVWPTGGERFLPIEAGRLDQLTQAKSTSHATAASLELTAAWSDGVLTGEGRLLFEGSTPGFVSWPLSPVSVFDAVWESGNPAKLGAWPTPGGDSVHGLATPGAGTLTFGFRSAAVAWQATEAKVTLDFPAALKRTINLTAPSWLRVSGDRLLATRRGPDPRDPTQDRWRIEAPPGTRLTLTVQDTRPVAADKAFRYSAAERTRLRINPGVIELTTRFDLASAAVLPDRLRVVAPAGLILESAEFAGEAARLIPQRTETGVGARVDVELPAGHGQSVATLVLRGVMPPAIGEPFLAPRPRLVDADWGEGVLTATLAPGLQLTDAEAEQDAAPEPRPGGASARAATLAYRLLGPQARVRLQFDSAPQRLQATAERRVQLDAAADQAEVVLRLESLTGPRPTGLDLTLSNGWRVESVEAAPESVLDRWSVVAGRPPRLRLLLNNDATEDELAEAVFTIRTQRPPRRTSRLLTLDQLRAVDARDVDLLADRMTIAAPNAQSLTPVGMRIDRVLTSVDGAAPLDADRLKLDLTDMSPEEFTLAGVRVAKRRASFAVDLSIDATRAPGGGVRYRVEAGLQPQRVSEKRIEVLFDAPLPADTQWFERRTGRMLAAQKIDDTSRRWRIVAPNGGWTGFVAESVLPDADRITIPRVAVVGAANKPVEATFGPSLVGEGWVDFAAARPRRGAAAGSLRCQYEPAALLNDASASSQQKLVWRRAETERPSAVLRSLTTRYDRDGVARHIAEYGDLAPGKAIEMRLPARATFLGADALGGRPVEVEQRGRALRVRPVDLGPNGWLRVRYLTSSDRLHHGGRLSPAAPELTATPPTPFAWRVTLPPGYRAATRGQAPLSLLDRLLGGDELWPLWRVAFGRLPESSSTRPVWAATAQTADSTNPLMITNTHVQRRWLLGVLMASLLVGASVLEWRRLWFLGAAVALAAVLIAPVDTAAMATAAGLGWLASAPFSLVVRRLTGRGRPGRRQLPISPEGRTTVSQRVAWLLLIGSAVAPPPVFAQAASPPDETAPELILTPIDGESQPVGDKVYAREAWLRTLLAQDERRQRAEPGEVLLRSAELRGIMRRSGEGELEPRTWTMRLELTTFARGARVTLPLRQADARWSPELRVDGEPRPLRWDPSGVGCSFDVDEPGPARAVLRFRPAVQLTEAEFCLRVALPALNDAKIGIRFPADHPGLRTPFLNSKIARDDTLGRLEASLASCEELLVCWTDESERAPARSAEVDLMQWVRVSPRGVYLDVQAQAAEPGADATGWGFVTPRGCQRIEPPAAASAAEQPSVRRVAFRLPRGAVVGRVRPPLVALSGAVVRSRSLAFSIDDRYAWSIEAGDGARSLDADEFLSRWAPIGLAPEIDRAMLVDGPAAPLLAVAPALASDLVTQRLRLTAGRAATTLRYEAEHNTGMSAGTGQRVFRVPKSMRIDRVAVERATQTVPSRWTRPRLDRLVVFFEEGIADGGLSRTLIEGQTPPQAEQSVEPIRDVRSSQPVSVSLLREDEALVEPQGPGWRPPPAGVPPRGATMIATSQHRPDEPPLSFTVGENPVRVRYATATRFDLEGRGVVVDWFVHGVVQAGELRRVPIAAREGIVLGGVTGVAGVRLELSDRVDGPDGWLVLPAPLTAGEAFTLRLSASLPASQGPLPTEPLWLSLPDAPNRFIALPPAKDRGRWDWVGLRGDDPPTWLVDAEPEITSGRLLTRLGPRARPRLALSFEGERVAAGPAVVFAYHQFLLGSDHETVVHSAMVLAASDAAECRVVLPPAAKLLSASVDGQRAPVQQDAADSELRVLLTAKPSGPRVLRLAITGQMTGKLAAPMVLPKGEASTPPVATLYEVCGVASEEIRGAADLTRLTAAQIAAGLEHAEGDRGLPPGSLTRQLGWDPLPTTERGVVGFLAEGPHEPPEVCPPKIATTVLRYLAAMLVVGIALASATRELWAPRRPNDY